ncbi:MAG TPA: protease modulator HflC [Spirochaetales bacterium]|nr:protease modulator HflC [Spirochaetales bacterium]HPG87021.1 protease modulator HflC [Spirochaetales bacterium]HPM72129.1 protease modulator HflC [Spirochaetales bacterium]
MKKLITVLVVAVVLLGLLVLMGPFYIQQEGFQSIIVRFGQITRVETEAGLKLKTPFIDNVVTYPKKILMWDGEAQRIPTKENQFIWVDATARWRISDPAKFYESISTLDSAFGKLDDVIDSAVRTVISSNFLREAVRNSNDIMHSTATETFETGDAEGSDSLRQLTQTDASYDTIDKGRRALSGDMLAMAQQLTPEYGIEIIDVIPRQIRYSDELTESVYNRMIKERNQIAQAFRSFGEGKKSEWMGKLENEQRSILSKAYEEAEVIKGTADARATKIYADAYGRDRSFFDFWRAIESYRATMPKFTKTLSTDMSYFDYLYGPKGR